MKTCNGCDWLGASVSLDGSYFCTRTPGKARPLGRWDLDEGVPTPDWCPKEDEKNE